MFGVLKRPSKLRESMFRHLQEQLIAELYIAQRRQALNVTRPPKREDRDSATDLYLEDAGALDSMREADLRIRVLAYWDLLSNILTREAFDQLRRDVVEAQQYNGQLSDVAHGLACRLYRRYVTVPAVEKLKSRVLRGLWFAFGVVATLGIVGLTLAATDCHLVLAQYLGAAVSGAAGATVSTTIRLNRIDPRREPLLSWLNLESGRASLYLSPVLGATFGVVILLFAHAELLKATYLLPSALESSSACTGNVALELARAGRNAVALTLLWAFVAGWAERLVPDVLNRLARQSTSWLPEPDSKGLPAVGSPATANRNPEAAAPPPPPT